MLINPPLILDSDLLSCFCDAQRMDILENLYPKQMAIMPHVIYEIIVVRKFKAIFEPSIKNGHIDRIDLDPLGSDGQEYAELRNYGKLGQGEAAALAYTRYHGGTVGSNNVSEVLKYCQSNNIGLLSVRPVMVDAVQKNIVSLAEAETIWQIFRTKSRAKLPSLTVADAINFYTNGAGARYRLQKS